MSKIGMITLTKVIKPEWLKLKLKIFIINKLWVNITNNYDIKSIWSLQF
jgi:hypothetical protein